MARGIQPTAQQLAEERSITLQAATAELKTWDRYEADLLTHLSHELSSGIISLSATEVYHEGVAQ